MDNQLSSSRYGSGGDNYRRGRGRGRGRYNSFRRGRGGYNRHDTRYQPYRREGGGRRQPTNRFESKETTKSENSDSIVSKQLAAMVAVISDFNACAKSPEGMGTSKMNNEDGTSPKMREVLRVVTQNIDDLVSFICTPDNVPMFLSYGSTRGQHGQGETQVNAETEAGPLATLITSCAATLPLQTPSYATLTLGIEENIPAMGEESKGIDYSGFARRCIAVSSRRLADDLDITCGVTSLGSVAETTEATNDYVQSFIRSKLILRYFALLSRVGIVESMGVDDEDMETSVDMTSLSLGRLLQLLVETASRAKSLDDESKNANPSLSNVSILLSALVLATIPYSLQVLTKDFVMNLLNKIDSIIEDYRSPFTPGNGMMSILLQKAQIEESVDEHGLEADDEEEDNDEDDDEDESAPVCADTFQDLVRTVRTIVDNYYGEGKFSTKFTLLTDSPWHGLNCINAEDQRMDSEDGNTTNSKGFMHSGKKVHISIPDSCRILHHLHNNFETFDENPPITFLRPSTEGIIFGRLSIFDPPPDDDSDDNDEDEVRNPTVDAYVKNFSLVDRFFLSDTIRDCLICHKAIVSSTGVEKGSARYAAEQLWSVSHLFVNDSDSSKGIECGVVEAILSLIVQSCPGSDSEFSMGFVYLSRVLIELAKFQPSCIPQSLALGVSDLFDDFLPSFSPLARDNLSHWFAFHLTNTDYQWPHAYWNVWAPHVVNGTNDKRNSRGEFVKKTLEVMVSYVSDPKAIASDCLPVQSKLIEYIIPESGSQNSETGFLSAIQSIETEVQDRIWKKSDEANDLADSIVGDEISETVMGCINEDVNSSTSDSEKIWWRTGVVIRSLLHPVSEKRKNLRRQVLHSLHLMSMDTDEDVEDPKADIITDTMECLTRYKALLLAALAKDIKVYEENLNLQGESSKSESELMLLGDSYVLGQCQKIASYSSVTLSMCLEFLVTSKVVSAKGVLQWILGSDGDGFNRELVSNGWWNFATLAMRFAIDDVLNSNTMLVESDMGAIGMTIDGRKDEEENHLTSSQMRMKTITDFVSPLLQFASDRIGFILHELKEDSKLSHYEADLKEGLKFFVRSVTIYVKKVLQNDEIIKGTNTDVGGVSLNVEAWVAKCAFDRNVGMVIS
jgi:MIF4G like.